MKSILCFLSMRNTRLIHARITFQIKYFDITYPLYQLRMTTHCGELQRVFTKWRLVTSQAKSREPKSVCK